MMNAHVHREIMEQLDGWASSLARPLTPPVVVDEGEHGVRLQFRHPTPHAAMIGKLVRAVSGIRAGLLLAESGYVAECASILRIVSDLCREVSAIGYVVHAGGEPPSAVVKFLDQYFAPRARTPEQLAAQEKVRYVSREALMKTEIPIARAAGVDPDHKLVLRTFLDMAYDSYVHGAYETSMELYDLQRGEFMMRGHRSTEKRSEFVEAVFMKMHEVVAAVQLTAAVTGHEVVFDAARAARRQMDTSAAGGQN
jgi:hypothetical protein